MVRIGPRSGPLETERVILRIGSDGDAPALLDYVVRNRSHHGPWEPRANPAFYTLEAQRRVIARRLDDFGCGEAACLLMFERSRPTAGVIGRCNFTEIVRGSFQACYLGYSVDAAYEGGGYMSEALRSALRWAFTDLRLHRVMANYRPENARSGRLLQRLGFVREGYARNYLFIDGRWTDHVLTALSNDAFEVADAIS